MCLQKKADKMIVTEEDLIQSNINSFGDDIGKITNWITTMFDVQSQYDPDSEEYKMLAYRIISGQLLQQDAIDKAKGIISKPMPRCWYDRHANKIDEEDTDEVVKRKKFNLSILADKKPYFMRYIYPDLMRQYNTYIKNSNKKAMREFRMSIEELEQLHEEDLTGVHSEFLRYYYERNPVGQHDCVMNRICRMVEQEFDGCLVPDEEDEEFDYSIMKSGCDYSKYQFDAIHRVYVQYTQALESVAIKCSKERISEEERLNKMMRIESLFRRACLFICSDARQLCDIILDLCYTKSGSKSFCWSMCGDEIIENLLERNGHKISFPTEDADGEIEFDSKRFTVIERECV